MGSDDSTIGQMDHDAEIAVDPREVDAAMIRGLYRRVGPLIIANFGALVLLTASLWGKTDTAALVAWAGTLGCWTMLRFGLAKAYARRPRLLEETSRWTLAFAAGATIAGCLWGASVLLVGGLEADDAKLVTAFLMAALSAAAIAGYTNSLLAFAGFLGAALIPYGIRLIWLDGSPSMAIAAFVIFWGALMGVMARHLNHGFRESIGLSLRNRNLAEHLRKQRDHVEAASRAKSRFLGHMSHELRTPLNHVIGYSEMMSHQILGPLGNDKYAEYASDIEASGRHLLDIVQSILDLTSLEAGEFELDACEVDLTSLLNAAVDRQAANSADVRFSCDLARDLPTILGDSARLSQVIEILLSNAARFTPLGGTVTVAGRRSGDGGIRVEVRDTGVGMTSEEIATVQIPFARLEKEDHLRRQTPDTSSGGDAVTGIDLPLAKLLVECHGGVLSIASKPGSGTVVSLSFPTGAGGRGEEAAAAA